MENSPALSPSDGVGGASLRAGEWAVDNYYINKLSWVSCYIHARLVLNHYRLIFYIVRLSHDGRRPQLNAPEREFPSHCVAREWAGLVLY
jgi:hypothetical protein